MRYYAKKKESDIEKFERKEIVKQKLHPGSKNLLKEEKN